MSKSTTFILNLYEPRGRGYQCQNKPVVTEDGKLYCRIHSPEYVKAKRVKQQAKWDKESMERQTQYALKGARYAATEGLTLEELKQVTPNLIRERILSHDVNKL